MACRVRIDGTIVAVASLQEILTEKSGRADGNTEPRGDHRVVTGRLAVPSRSATEGEVKRADEINRIRQTSLPR